MRVKSVVREVGVKGNIKSKIRKSMMNAARHLPAERAERREAFRINDSSHPRRSVP